MSEEVLLAKHATSSSNGAQDDDSPPKSRRALYTLVSFACIGGSLFGYDTGVISGAMIQISNKCVGLNLNKGEQEMVVSITTAGAFVGAPTASHHARYLFVYLTVPVCGRCS